MDRRRLLRLLAAAPAAAPALARREAAALRGWCRIDPVVLVDGQVAHVRVAAQVGTRAEARRLATGPIELRLAAPPGVDVRYLADDDGFGHGYLPTVAVADQLVATEAEVPVEVAVRVPMLDGADGPVPVRVAFRPAGANQLGRRRLRPGGGEGVANAWVAFRTSAEADAPPDAEPGSA